MAEVDDVGVVDAAKILLVELRFVFAQGARHHNFFFGFQIKSGVVGVRLQTNDRTYWNEDQSIAGGQSKAPGFRFLNLPEQSLKGAEIGLCGLFALAGFVHGGFQLVQINGFEQVIGGRHLKRLQCILVISRGENDRTIELA